MLCSSSFYLYCTFTTATMLTKVLYRRARLYHIHRKQTRQKKSYSPFRKKKWWYHISQYTKENKYVFSKDLKRDGEGNILISKGRLVQSWGTTTVNAHSPRRLSLAWGTNTKAWSQDHRLLDGYVTFIICFCHCHIILFLMNYIVKMSNLNVSFIEIHVWFKPNGNYSCHSW